MLDSEMLLGLVNQLGDQTDKSVLVVKASWISDGIACQTKEQFVEWSSFGDL